MTAVLPLPAAPPGATPRLGRQVLAVAIAQGAPQLVTLLAATALAARVPPGTFGIWTVTLSLVALVAVLDGGVLATVTWRISVEIGARRHARVPALLAWAAGAALAVGGLAALTAAVAAAPVVDALGLGGPERDQAVACLHLVAPLVGLSLLNALATGYLRAVGADAVVVAAAATGVLLFAVTTAAAWGSSTPVTAVVGALVAQGAGSCAVAAAGVLRSCAEASSRGHGGPPAGTAADAAFAPRAGVLARYAGHSQVANLTALITLQLDGIVVAALSTPEQLGAYGVGATCALAFRTAPFFVLTPVRTRLGLVAGAHGPAAAGVEAARIQRRWRWWLAGYVALVAPAGAAVAAHLGDGASLALLTYALLSVGYVANLSVGVAVAHLAATGRTRAVARSGIFAVAANLVLTAPLALALGPAGVVLATAVGQVLSPLPVHRASRALIPTPSPEGLAR